MSTSHVMSQAQALEFFEDILTHQRLVNGDFTVAEIVNPDLVAATIEETWGRQLGTVIKWQVTLLQLIEADENHVNPSRRPLPGVNVYAPDYDSANDWPTDVNRVIHEYTEVRALASMLYSNDLLLPVRKAHVIEVTIPYLLGYVTKVVDLDNNEIPGAMEGLHRQHGASRLASAIAFGRVFLLGVRAMFVAMARGSGY